MNNSSPRLLLLKDMSPKSQHNLTRPNKLSSNGSMPLQLCRETQRNSAPRTNQWVVGSSEGSSVRKFRSTMRFAAAASNASIAKQVAEKRAKIADGRREAGELVRRLQSQIFAAKKDRKSLSSQRKAQSKSKGSIAKSASESLDLLQKLKGAYESGLLTEQEYEEKRTKLISQI